MIALVRIHRLIPHVPIGLLALPGPGGAWARSWLGRLIPYQSLNPEWKDDSPRLVKDAHRRKRKVFTYTVNQENAMRRLLAMGADGFFTDDPVLAQKVLSDETGPSARPMNAEGEHPEPASLMQIRVFLLFA